MMNEISREAKELVENVSELADDARRRCYQKDVCDELHQAQAELIDYIATIEAENYANYYEVDSWDFEEDRWKFFTKDDVFAYAEIRPYGKESE